MVRLRKDRARARLSGVPFDYPLCPYIFQLVDYFIRGSEHTSHMVGTVHISEAVGIQDIQWALGHMHLGTGLIEASDAMMVEPQSPDRTSVFSMCFPMEFIDYDLLMDPREGTDDVTPHNAYGDEMDMIGIGRILDIAPHMLHSSFDLFRVSIFETDGATPYDAYVDEMDMIGRGRILDVAPHRSHYPLDMFGVLMLEMDDEDFVTDVSHYAIFIKGASDFMDPPLSFDTMFGFVTTMVACLRNTIMI